MRVVLGEDTYLVREGLRRLLATQPGIEVAAACGDLQSLLQAIDDFEPDVVVTDIRMPPDQRDEGIQVATWLRERRPATGLVVLSHYADPQLALALLERGSAGRAYLLKERVHDVEQLVAAIRAVASGESVIDPIVVEGIIAAGATAPAPPLGELTPREREILAEIAQGKSNAAIAESLVIAEHSVEKHITAIFAKLGLSWEQAIHRRVKAVLVYLAAHGEGGLSAPARAPSRPLASPRPGSTRR